MNSLENGTVKTKKNITTTKKKAKMKLTKRGKRVRAVAWLGGFIVIYILATHINWVGDGYCWGTIDKCYPATIGGK